MCVVLECFRWEIVECCIKHIYLSSISGKLSKSSLSLHLVLVCWITIRNP